MEACKHVLIVDHTEAIRDIVRDMLEYDGYRVSVADGGGPMRDFLQTDDAVSLVVLEAGISAERSAALALYVKSLSVPLVMISGHPEAMEFAQEHNLQLLWKPFNSASLLAAMNEAFSSGEFGQRGAT